MRVKLLKRVMRDGRIAMGVSAGVMVGRFVVDRLANKTEKAALSEEQSLGEVSRSTSRKLRVLRLARAIAHIL